MFPLEISGVTLLVDRHYNSLQPLRRHPNIYVVRFQEQCAMRYISAFDDHLILRSCDPHDPFEVVRTKRSKGYSECIVGRLCHVGVEV